MQSRPPLETVSQNAVEIKLWGIYPFRNRHRLYNILATYSLDGGPNENDFGAHDRISFRFLVYDWQKTLQKLLTDNNIPFVIHSYFVIQTYNYRRRRKVLIAEDDLDILSAMNMILENAGYDVQLSPVGKPLLEDTHLSADVVILDKRMPDIDGIDVCRHLRSQKSTQHTPVIMISASRDFGQQALEAGVDDYLEKPFEMNKLLQIVAKYANREKNNISNLQLR
jgi:CheY-like chemotaxis protein